MSGVLFGLVVAVLVLVLVLAVLSDYTIRLAAQRNSEDRADHAKCVAHVADMSSRRIAAITLRDLADRYDNGEERIVMERIKREQWTPEGPVLPILWLRHHAEALERTDA